MDDKVYLLTAGEHDDYEAVAAFSSRDKAAEAQRILTGCNIEEYVLDIEVPAIKPGCKIFWATVCSDRVSRCLTQDATTTIASIRATNWTIYEDEDALLYLSGIQAVNEAEAEKIANEKRLAILSHGWPRTSEDCDKLDDVLDEIFRP